ncbi:MAG: isoprenylcysteine carboxylmethyltransferase family protein [Proteobacteria bacterium]|nr:isoprenylcysteine carboxylmethyltransferase family protein [Pseudomonadota bacterium]
MVRAIVITVALFFLLSGCVFGAAGQFSWPMAWAFLGIYFVSKLVGLAFADPELIGERAAPGPGVDRGDMVIAALGYLGLYPGTLVVAGLDAIRFGPAVLIPQSIQIVALLIFAFGYGFASWAVLSNPFFATFVRIQNDRGHSVVSSGAYALVRHPGYAGVLLSHLALPFALGSIWALVPSAVGTIFFIVRTAREDKILQDHLIGYREYQTRVRWRLLPGVW